MAGEIERYVAWLRNLLAEGREDPGYRALLTRVVADLGQGRQTIGGAFIPSSVIGPLTDELLPELEAELTRQGGPLAPAPAPPARWPARTRREARELAARLAELPAVDPLPPYRSRRSAAVGGLYAAGFAPGTEMLLVVSANGLGVFDGDGARVARKADRDDLPGYPDAAEGIGPIAGVVVPLMGIHGGAALPRSTPDGWQLGVLDPEDCTGIWTAPPGVSLDPPGPGCVRLIGRYEEIRAAGYSASGRTLVIAEQHTLHLFVARAD